MDIQPPEDSGPHWMSHPRTAARIGYSATPGQEPALDLRTGARPAVCGKSAHPELSTQERPASAIGVRTRGGQGVIAGSHLHACSPRCEPPEDSGPHWMPRRALGQQSVERQCAKNGRRKPVRPVRLAPTPAAVRGSQQSATCTPAHPRVNHPRSAARVGYSDGMGQVKCPTAWPPHTKTPGQQSKAIEHKQTR